MVNPIQTLTFKTGDKMTIDFNEIAVIKLNTKIAPFKVDIYMKNNYTFNVDFTDVELANDAFEKISNLWISLNQKKGKWKII